jgi:hypothetical protein
MRPDAWYLTSVSADCALLTAAGSTRRAEPKRGVRNVVLPQVYIKPSPAAFAAWIELTKNQAAYEYHLLSRDESRCVPVDDAVAWHMWTFHAPLTEDAGRDALREHPAAAALFYTARLDHVAASKTLFRLGDPRFYGRRRIHDLGPAFADIHLTAPLANVRSAATTAWAVGDPDDGGSGWVSRYEQQKRREYYGRPDAYPRARLRASQKFWSFVLRYWMSVATGRLFDPGSCLSPDEVEEFTAFSSNFRFSGQTGRG